MIILEKLKEYGICKATMNDVGICDKCDFNFDYAGQYNGDTPYPACEVLRAIILEAMERAAPTPNNGSEE